MPYRQVFHENSEFNNKIMDKPLFHQGGFILGLDQILEVGEKALNDNGIYLNFEGDGFGSLFSSAGNMAGRFGNMAGNFAGKTGRFVQSGVNFIGKNKDAIEGIANLAGGVKTVYDTINSTQKANEELRQMKIKFDNEANMYQKMFDYQNQLKKAENEKKKLIEQNKLIESERKQLASKSETSNFAKTEIPKLIPSYIDKKIINEDQPITYTTNTDTKSKNSSLNESQLEAIRNMNKRGEGMKKKSKTQKVGKGLRIY